jgi:hypothetical protein
MALIPFVTCVVVHHIELRQPQKEARQVSVVMIVLVLMQVLMMIISLQTIIRMMMMQLLILLMVLLIMLRPVQVKPYIVALK